MGPTKPVTSLRTSILWRLPSFYLFSLSTPPLSQSLESLSFFSFPSLLPPSTHTFPRFSIFFSSPSLTGVIAISRSILCVFLPPYPALAFQCAKTYAPDEQFSILRVRSSLIHSTRVAATSVSRSLALTKIP